MIVVCILCILCIISIVTYYLLDHSIISAMHNKTWVDKNNMKTKFRIDEMTKQLFGETNGYNYNVQYTLIDSNTLIAETNSQKITYILENYMTIKVVEFVKNTKETRTGYLKRQLF